MDDDQVVETSDLEELSELKPFKTTLSPSPSLTNASSRLPTSPVRTPPAPLTDVAMVLDPPSEPLPTPPKSQRARSESVDPLLLFSPARPAITTPEPRTPPNISQPSSPLTPAPVEDPETNKDMDIDEPEPDPPQEWALADEQRYTLRQRNPKQINPYQHDRAVYQKTMRRMPEAIVKIRSPRPHHPHHKSREDRYEDEEGAGESQDAYVETQDAAYVETQDAGPSQRPLDDELRRFVPPMEESSDDERMQVMLREAHELAQEKKGKKRRRLRKKARAFPVQQEEHPERSPSRPQTPDNDWPMPDHQSPKSSSPVRNIMASPEQGNAPLPWSDDDEEGTTSDTAIVIDDHVQQTVEEPQALSRREAKLKEKMRVMKRIYPAFMLQKMMRDDNARSRRARRHASSSSEDEQPSKLQPGQSRTTKGKGPRERAPVVGDSESETEPRKASQSDSDVEVVAHKVKERKRKISDSENDEEKPAAPSPPRSTKAPPVVLLASRSYDRYIIDWMVSNTADSDNRGKLKVQKERDDGPPPRKRRRHGATLDSYFPRERRQRRRDGDSAPRRRKVNRQASGQDHHYPGAEVDDAFDYGDQEAEVDNGFDYGDGAVVHNIPDPEHSREMDQRQRQALARSNGVHVLQGPTGRRIVGQRVNGRSAAPGTLPSYFNENRSRPKAVAGPSKPRHGPRHPRGPRQAGHVPVPRHVAGRPLPPPPRAPDHRPLSPIDVDEYEDDDDSEPEVVEIWDLDLDLDFGITLVAVNTHFEADTYTGRGFLSELLSADAAPRAQICSFDDFHLGPDLSVRDVVNLLEPLCNRFLEFATGIPDPDSADQETRWFSVSRAVCHLVTSLLAAGDDADTLVNAVEKCVRMLTTKLRAAALESKAMDRSTFAICWFAVELAFRAGFRWDINKNSINPFNLACEVLLEYLVEFGFENIVTSLVHKTPLDGTTTSNRALECLLGLWHLAHHNQQAPAAVNPIWLLAKTALEKHRLSGASKVTTKSEQAWHAIISICTVSQFSAAGRVNPQWVQDHHVPRASWDIVKFALQQLERGFRDKSQTTASVDDVYLKLVVERCCLLWSRWQWKFDGAVAALIKLGNILRSRMFANLPNEGEEFPPFIQMSDWELLARPVHSETAFVLFLKLVHQTLLADTVNAQRLLKAVIPIPSSSKERPALCTIINRLSLLVVALHIHSQNHIEWMKMAREYIGDDFKDAPPHIRVTYIRAFMYLTIELVGNHIAPPVDWFREMMDELLPEVRATKPNKEAIVCIKVLARTLQKIFLATKGYPSIDLFDAFFQLLPPSLLDDDDPGVMNLVQAFLETRAASIRKAKSKTPEPVEESQDEYGAMDADLTAAMDAKEAEQENKIFQIVQKVRWAIWRRLERLLSGSGIVKSFKEGSEASRDVATLAHTWVCCGHLLAHHPPDKVEWSNFLQPYFSKSETWDYFCQCRVNLLVLYNVLKQDVAAYPVDESPKTELLQSRFLDVFAECLVSWYATNEAGYVDALLSIEEHRHPLLLGASAPPETNSAAPKLDRLRARLPLLRVILQNIADSVSAGESNLMRYASAMFAYMRRTSSELEAGSEESQSYDMFCKDVVQAFREQPVVLQHERLRQFDQWTAKF
uniref:Telomere-associated protein Rif1 N-terminal domain-containing protein n=1 Tax=Mycena chlorophos TaxID=658473 RepID=A0ABQ0KWI4_MYCCL|nr:predicted protein [Mycena chlorophos]